MEFHIPQVYYCNAGTIMRRELFEKLTFYSEEIFIFVDDDFPMKDCVQTIENGMYACIIRKILMRNATVRKSFWRTAANTAIKSAVIIFAKKLWK